MLKANLDHKKYTRVFELFSQTEDTELTRRFVIIAAIHTPQLREFLDPLYEKSYTDALQEYNESKVVPMSMIVFLID